MEPLKLRLSLVVADEEALYDLERWLKSTSIQVELEITRPTEEELGGKAVALLLVCSLLNESLEGAIEQVFRWSGHHPDTPIELSLTGREDIDDPIREQVKDRPLNVHIELREPEPPPIKTPLWLLRRRHQSSRDDIRYTKAVPNLPGLEDLAGLTQLTRNNCHDAFD